MKNLESFGRFVGENFGKKGLDHFRRKVDNFEVSVQGLENLRELGERPYILVANHVRPKGDVANSSGLAADALILERIIKQETGRDLKIVAKTDFGPPTDNPTMQNFQKKIAEPFGQGLKKGMGFIPVNMNYGGLKREFVKSFDQAVKDGHPILIFPQGHWSEGFTEQTNLQNGAAAMAIKYNLPIVPAYIQGADSWEEGSKAQLSFGKSLQPEADKVELTEQVKQRILELK